MEGIIYLDTYGASSKLISFAIRKPWLIQCKVSHISKYSKEYLQICNWILSFSNPFFTTIILTVFKLDRNTEVATQLLRLRNKKSANISLLFMTVLVAISASSLRLNFIFSKILICLAI